MHLIMSSRICKFVSMFLFVFFLLCRRFAYLRCVLILEQIDCLTLLLHGRD